MSKNPSRETGLPTVGSELRLLFPDGTRRTKAGRPSWRKPPLLPVDVFTAAAHLLDRSGAYQYVVAPFAGAVGAADGLNYQGITRSPSLSDIATWCGIGKAWALEFQVVDDQVATIWRRLWKARRRRLVENPNVKDRAPCWWGEAHALLVIADEASADFGYTATPSEGIGVNGRWANELAALDAFASTERSAIDPHGSGEARHLSRHVALDSFALAASRHVRRVFPKGRTTEIGCNFRTLSHNLALLPPHGQANAYWHQSPAATPPETLEKNKLRLLVVPFPYVVPEAAFQWSESVPAVGERRWGRFRIEQTWLRPGGDAGTAGSTKDSRRQLIGFLDALLAKAGDVDAILLPEYALDWKTYDALVRHVRDHRPEIEFVISGISKDCNGRVGNQVAVSVFDDDEETGSRLALTHSRRKHHRWQIDGSQLDVYGLAPELDRSVVWWEHLEVEERVMHFDVFRQKSTITAVICEDLARVEPGLSMLRTLGPNLVFALLMDGPQVKGRWPGIYATGLADDPGSSVLSITSAALVDRSNRAWAAKGGVGKRSVALWKNKPREAAGDDQNFAELLLDNASQALIVDLQCEAARETTIDGRPNSDATAWYLAAHAQVALDPAAIQDSGWDWIANAVPPA